MLTCYRLTAHQIKQQGFNFDNASFMQPEKTTRTIKQQLAALAPTLEQLGKQKKERIKEFADIMSRIEQIRGEIAGSIEIGHQVAIPQINEDDLTDDKLRDFQSQLQELEKQKVCISLFHLFCSNIWCFAMVISLVSWRQ
jgi:hypothetical protein